MIGYRQIPKGDALCEGDAFSRSSSNSPWYVSDTLLASVALIDSKCSSRLDDMTVRSSYTHP